MPVVLELRYADGTTARRRIPVEAFATGDTHRFFLERSDLVGITLDPDGLLPDIDRANNTWDGAIVPPRPKG